MPVSRSKICCTEPVFPSLRDKEAYPDPQNLATRPRILRKTKKTEHLESRVEGTHGQPIKALLIVSENICSCSKPISRLSGAEITGALAT